VRPFGIRSRRRLRLCRTYKGFLVASLSSLPASTAREGNNKDTIVVGLAVHRWRCRSNTTIRRTFEVRGLSPIRTRRKLTATGYCFTIQFPVAVHFFLFPLNRFPLASRTSTASRASHRSFELFCKPHGTVYYSTTVQSSTTQCHTVPHSVPVWDPAQFHSTPRSFKSFELVVRECGGPVGSTQIVLPPTLLVGT